MWTDSENMNHFGSGAVFHQGVEGLLRGFRRHFGTTADVISHLVLGVKLDLKDFGAVDLAPCALADDLGGEHEVLEEDNFFLLDNNAFPASCLIVPMYPYN